MMKSLSPSSRHVIRTKHLYVLPPRFYGYQLLALAITGLLFFWFSGNESIDRVLTNYWFDPALHQFPWKDNVLLDAVNHRLAKYLVIAAGIIVLFAGLIRRHHRLVTVAILMGAGALVVGLLKAVSHHSCPWDLMDYGGQAVSWPLFGQIPANSGPGHCFPGGHASSGFMVMAFFFLFYPEKPRLAWISLMIGIVLGLAMGYGQVMRGAHFFSHNLWAGWWVWLTQVIGYFAISHFFSRKQGQL